METKRGRVECHCFWFPDWWLFGRAKYVFLSPAPLWEVMAYSYLSNPRWPEVCFRFGSGLRYSLGRVRGCWCLSFQDDERQHSSSTPSPTRKYATTTVIITVPCFRLEHLYRSSLSRIHTYSGLPLMHLYTLPIPPHFIGCPGWTLPTSVLPILQNQACVRRPGQVFLPDMWPGGVCTVVTPCQLHLLTRRAKKCAHHQV